MAEELVFHSVTTGASNDIEQATKLARAMITRFGMSDEFDMVAMETVTNQYLSRMVLQGSHQGVPHLMVGYNQLFERGIRYGGYGDREQPVSGRGYVPGLFQ